MAQMMATYLLLNRSYSTGSDIASHSPAHTARNSNIYSLFSSQTSWMVTIQSTCRWPSQIVQVLQVHLCAPAHPPFSPIPITNTFLLFACHRSHDIADYNLAISNIVFNITSLFASSLNLFPTPNRHRHNVISDLVLNNFVNKLS